MIDGVTLWRLELGLAVGTPALAALGLMVSALPAGLRSSGALAGLLALPLAVPLLLFGAGMLTSESGAPLKFFGAALLLLDLKSVVWGKSGCGRVIFGGWR